MGELLPTVQAESIRVGLTDYLTTTFALADADARSALDAFLSDGRTGIFRGPYVRIRLPYAPAPADAPSALEWPTPFPAYVHQAAAFRRLSTLDLGPDKPRPLPTLVTTGTGSGKTEAFLYPILDHVLRAKDRGITGMKALILYPMNALANDQAQRLARLITDPARGLAGVTAGLYTGQSTTARTVVSADGLISDREVLRDSPPDIVLTNYKMLDQLLLRAADQRIWEESAESLTYVVLDEFHTYDGAQGTDVAMLLRRLGLTLKSWWDPARHTAAELARPLGRMTPVATSATLGAEGDPAAMVEFAGTVFGEPFDRPCVVTETRVPLEAWVADAPGIVARLGLTPLPVTAALVGDITTALRTTGGPSGADLAAAVLNGLYAADDGSTPAAVTDQGELVALAKAHPLVQALIRRCGEARALEDLAASLLPGIDPAAGVAFLTHLLGALSHLRAVAGRDFVTLEAHLWVRELTRIDRDTDGLPHYRWSDDETAIAGDSRDTPAFPAIYCRRCGRSGWGVCLAPTGSSLDHDDKHIRARHAQHEGRFRPLIHAASEAAHLAEAPDEPIEGLGWLDLRDRTLTQERLDLDSDEVREGRYLPILTHWDKDAEDASRADTCPACGMRDGIRFLGSAIATQVSVTLSSLFGTEGLDPAEKKALVFTDSVQDAAHRAGFIQARSHTLTLRAALCQAIDDYPETLDRVVQKAIDTATDPFSRYRLLPPDLVERKEFAPFWQADASPTARRRATRRTEARLLFDAMLEFGLQMHFGRTLEMTGTAAVDVDGGSEIALAGAGRAALETTGEDALVSEVATIENPDLVRWVRGVLERLRSQGAIRHDWLEAYLENDGSRWYLWAGRPRGLGMPAFPTGRSAPAFPRIGGAKPTPDPLLDNATSPQGWYALWTSRVLGVTPHFGARLIRTLLGILSRNGTVRSSTTKSGGTVYGLESAKLLVHAVPAEQLRTSRYRLRCSVCGNEHPGGEETISQLDGGPCLLVRCPGTVHAVPLEDNYYRRLYSSADMRRIVAREHTSLIDDAERVDLEDRFRSGRADPSSPNVLVATPTLEMGIDIGDLSAVLLSSLPRTVASYLQRVGRAGRLTGNALDLSFVTGRGENLARLHDPLSLINGSVRPPATYLSAEEILQRQYVAHVLDGFARDETRLQPRLGASIMGSTEPGTFLGSLIDEAEGRADTLLPEFLAALGAGVGDPAAQALRDWATPAHGPRSSGLARQVIRASAAWTRSRDDLVFREKEIQAKLPALEQAEGSPRPTEDDKRALRTARAALAQVRRQQTDVNSQYWIATLEEFGLLPNYTLVDDHVTLDVAVSWINPDDQQYENDSFPVERGAANALREFAPGATFYTRGLEIDIDSVDLGPNAQAIRPMAVCAACGWSADISAAGAPEPPTACPRCGSTSVRDTGNQLDVVELTHVTAAVRRDEATISDSRDERKRPGFALAVAADIDPEAVSRRWRIDGYAFGAKYLRRMTIRWFNVGARVAYGHHRTIGGLDVIAPLFRVCEGCGCLDHHAKQNRPEEHRPWCPYRKSPTEKVREIALSRTLVTQGVVLPLPPTVTLSDPFALPSLSAAILLGLQEQFGGAPDHIRIETITDPAPGQESDPRPALLLYDTVPGGTGYLAELAAPETLYTILHKAWRRVADCACRGEDVLACHRCLLPHAVPWQSDLVARQTAERHLRSILTAGGTAEPTGEMTWPVQEGDVVGPPVGSHLEQAFHQQVRAMLKGMDVRVTDEPTPAGNRLRFRVGPRDWSLDPQVNLLDSKPDFVLACSDSNVPDVAIFTDGQAYHATIEVNRVSDDALKRAHLAASGRVVLSVTAQDLEVDESGQPGPWTAPPWLQPHAVGMLANDRQLQPSDFVLATEGPLAFLRRWIRMPFPAQQGAVADVLPLMFCLSAGESFAVPADHDLADLARRLTTGGSVLLSSRRSDAYLWRHGALSILVRVGAGEVLEVAAVLDDRPASVDSVSFGDAWRSWLTTANVLQLRAHPTIVTTLRAITEAAAPLPALVREPAAPAARVDVAVPALWQVVLDDPYAGAEKQVARALVAAHIAPPATYGEEVGDTGIPAMFVWPEERVVVLYEEDSDSKDELLGLGWHVVGPDADAIRAALDGEGDD